MIEAAAAAAAQIQAEEEAEEEDTFQDNEVARRPRVSRFRSSIALSHNSSTVTQNGSSTRRVSTTNNIDETSNTEIEKAVAADIAVCISNQLKTLGLIGALLSSWAVTVYGGERPFDDGLCFGRGMVQASYVVFWVSLGFFFLCVSSSLAIIADLDGVPQKYLFRHFKQRTVRLTYQIPEISMIFGIIFLAAGYAIDIGERSGCIFFYFGCAASFGFVSMVAALFWILRRARQHLRDETICSNGSNNITRGIGRHFIATSRDRLDYCLDLTQEDVEEMSKRRQSIGGVLVQ